MHRVALLGGVGLLVWVAAARDSQRLAELRPQEQRTPQPVSIKRLEKVWGQLNY